MVKTVGLNNYSDVHFTNDALAQKIINHFSPQGIILEPFSGDDAFLKWLPKGSEWCEIEKGRDFFDWKKPVDWIITNPPFSNLTLVFEHAFSISEHCVFLIPISKYWSSKPRIDSVAKYGGLKEVLHVGTGRQIGFDIGFPFAAMYFAKNYRDKMIKESYL